jgi:hypothetical protein
VLTDQKTVLQRIADELLAREVLDADQVERLVKGLPLEEAPPAPVRPAVDEPAPRVSAERPPLVPQIRKPVTQE